MKAIHTWHKVSFEPLSFQAEISSKLIQDFFYLTCQKQSDIQGDLNYKPGVC